MILKRRTPGEPLVALAFVLAGWVGARVLAWEVELDAIGAERTPAGQVEQARPVAPAARGFGNRAAAGVAAPDLAAQRPVASGPAVLAHQFAPPPYVSGPDLPGPDLPGLDLPGQVLLAPFIAPPAAEAVAPPAPSPVPALPPSSAPNFTPPVVSAGTMPAVPAERIAVAGGHQMLWLAATAYLPLPPLGLRTAPAAPAGPARRWSGDGWLLLRRGDGTIAPGPVVGNYGASQMGAVLRYRLVTTDRHRPAAYIRATAALNGTREQQVALGLSARPVPRIPVTALAELRQVRDSAGERLRPALALITELPPQRLPLGFTGELYAQGGYVGGRNPTAFIDGLARAERPLADLAGFRLRAGGGAWAAKQRGAARVDVGPSASVSFRLTDTASARLAADWRFRVGGRSKPDSGPALTLSAGF